jgi:hypothetical protein
MAKRSQRQPIADPDVTNVDLKYWDKVLASHNLDMNRGVIPHAVPLTNLREVARQDSDSEKTEP